MDIPQAFTPDNLAQILDSNANCHDISDDRQERLLTVAQDRAADRGNALSDEQTDCLLIAGTWDGYAEDTFGRDSDDTLNRIAIGTIEYGPSATRDAVLFTDVAVVQTGWLRSGDGRRKRTALVENDYDGADDGTLWVPKSAIEYLCVVELSKELVHDDVAVAEAM